MIVGRQSVQRVHIGPTSKAVLEDSLVHCQRVGHPGRVLLRVAEIIQEAVDDAGVEAGMVVAPIAAEEGVQKPLRIAGRKSVLRPKQEVEVFRGHDRIQLVPT